MFNARVIVAVARRGYLSPIFTNGLCHAMRHYTFENSITNVCSAFPFCYHAGIGISICLRLKNKARIGFTFAH